MERVVTEQFVVVVSTIHRFEPRLVRMSGQEVIGPTYPTNAEIANAIIKYDGHTAFVRKEYVLV